MAKRKPVLTYGFRPSLLPASELVDLMHGIIQPDRVTLFFKHLLLNAPKVGGHQDFSQYIYVEYELLGKIFGQHQASGVIQKLVELQYIQYRNHVHFDNPELAHQNKPRAYRVHPRLLPDLTAHVFENEKRPTFFKRNPIYDKKTFNAYNNMKAYINEKKLERMLDVRRRLSSIAQQRIYLDLDSTFGRKFVRDNRLNVKKKFMPYSELAEFRLINEGLKQLYKNDDNGRYYSHWVPFPKRNHPLIRFVGYDDEFVCDVDLKASQPFFLSLLNKSFIRTFLPEADSVVRNCSFESADWDDFRRLAQTGDVYQELAYELSAWDPRWQEYFTVEQVARHKKKAARHPKNLKRYKKDLKKFQDGKLYRRNDEGKKYLVKNEPQRPKRPKLKFLYNEIDGRKAAKYLMNRVLFGTQKDCPVNQAFKKRWPQVWEDLRLMKERKAFANKSPKGAYTNVSWMLTRVESTILIDGFCGWLMDKGFMAFTPRHDSFTCPESQGEFVKYCTVDYFVNELGLVPPQLKIESCWPH